MQVTRWLWVWLGLYVSAVMPVLAQVPAGGLGQAFESAPFNAEPEFLPVDEAFVFDYQQQGQQLTVTFTIAPGYYLYRKQFKTAVKDARLGAYTLPEGEPKEDETFGKTEVYYQRVSFTVPVEQAADNAIVKLRYQGCADAGLCYPPATKLIYLDAVTAAQPTYDITQTAPEKRDVSDFSYFTDITGALHSQQNIALTLLVFLALGIGLAFTPCVFPMYPILSGIVLGQASRNSMARAAWLSFVYVQGMALTYSLLGLAVASAGMQFQAALQHPAILITFIALFIVLALAMFGSYELQLPSSWQTRLNALSNRQRAGSIAGVFVMGVLSGLIASPCTTAPLTGILLYIAQSGDQLTGFISLYVLSLGMGIPLILFGMTGGKLLPKAGNWMNVVKVTFGFMMLAVAIVFVERLWTHPLSDLLWAALGLSTFTYYALLNQPTRLTFAKGIRALVIFIGLFSSAMLAYQTLLPTQSSTQVAHPPFIKVASLSQFQAQLTQASAQGRPVMLDLYADWCVACKEFEKYTFSDERVITALSDAVWMQIDLTDRTPDDIAFEQHFAVLGLPTILFFDTKGQELDNARVTGFMQAEAFAQHVDSYFNGAARSTASAQ